MRIFFKSATWGWACASYRELTSAVEASPEAALSSRGEDVHGQPTRVLVVPVLYGAPMVIRLSEVELDALGPCPNL